VTNVASLDLCAKHRKAVLAVFKPVGGQVLPQSQGGRARRRSGAEMTKFRKEVLDFVRTAKEINNEVIRKHFNVSGGAATRVLSQLVKAKKLKLSGRSDAAGYTYSGKE